MSDSNFTPPEVVWIDTSNLEEVVENDYYSACCVSLPVAAFEADDTSYTLTSSVEKAKREAVRNALSELRQSMADNTEINGCVRRGDVYFRIDKLLTQYQEPIKEQSDDKPE